MSDLERLLKSTLQEAGGAYRPSDEAAARRRFLEQRRKRRFRFAAAGAVVTATAVLIAVVAVPRLPDDTERPELASAIAPEVMATIPAGDGPTGIGSGNEGIWVADPDAGVVSQIDPATNEVVATIELPGTSPDEVVAGDGVVWASDGGGSLAMIDPATSSRQLTVPLPGVGDSSLDLALGEEQSVWAVDPATGRVYRVSGDLPEESSIEGLSSTDVAAGDEGVWVLDGPAGSWADITPLGTPRKMTPVIDAPGVIEGGPNADLAVGFGYLWISTGGSGSVYRVDPSTEEVEVINVGGRYADLTVGEGAVWALVAGEESAELVAIDPGSATVSGEPLSLGAGAIDVVTGHGSLWVPDKSGASVLRIDPTPDNQATPHPETTDDVAEESPAPGAQIIFAFSANGDIYLQYDDGTTELLTPSGAIEVNPEFGYTSLFYERHDDESDDILIVEHDLLSGDDRAFEGSQPAFSPGGDLAWVDPLPIDEPLIHVAPYRNGKVQEDQELVFSAGEFFTEVRALEWSDDGEALYYQAKGEGWVTVRATVAGVDGDIQPFVLNGVNDQPQGSNLVSPANATGGSIEVASVCCSMVEGDPHSQVDIGQLVFTEGGATYSDLTAEPLTFGPGPVDPGSIELAWMDELAFRNGSWELFTGTRSWILSYAGNVWLVDEDGGRVHLGGPDGESILGLGHDPGFGGFALNPALEGHF
jgi:streptogramin lyase